jgi:hypothetical protein
MQFRCLQVFKFYSTGPRLKGGIDVDGGTPLEIVKVNKNQKINVSFFSFNPPSSGVPNLFHLLSP